MLFRVLEKDFIFSEILPHSYILQIHAVKSPAVFFPIHLIPYLSVIKLEQYHNHQITSKLCQIVPNYVYDGIMKSSSMHLMQYI